MPDLRETLERLYEEQAAAIFRFALVLTRSEEDAKDILQEVFCRLADKPKLLRDARNERALLFRMTRNLAIDGMRRRKVREAYAESEKARELFAFAIDPDEKAWREVVASALNELPVEQRVVLHLKIWEDMTLEGIARTLEIPAGTAASRFRYAMNKLEDLLRPFYEEMKK